MNRPELPPARPKKEHKHKWVYQESHYSYNDNGYLTTYKKLDIYYCQECLEIKEILKEDDCSSKPLWWIH